MLEGRWPSIWRSRVVEEQGVDDGTGMRCAMGFHDEWDEHVCKGMAYF